MPALVCLGTSFGMGLIVSTFMLSTGGMGTAVIAGNLGAVVGSVVATRLMLRRAGRCLGRDTWCELSPKEDVPPDVPSSGGLRVMGAIMQGGKNGVELGLSIIPGVLIVCTLMFLLTGGPGEEGVYTGAAYEGIGLLPWLGEKLSFLLCPLFGFSSAEAIAVPVTAMALPEQPSGWCRSCWSRGRQTRGMWQCLPPCVCAGAAISAPRLP